MNIEIDNSTPQTAEGVENSLKAAMQVVTDAMQVEDMHEFNTMMSAAALGLAASCAKFIVDEAKRQNNTEFANTEENYK